jgi:hypothetical protein
MRVIEREQLQAGSERYNLASSVFAKGSSPLDPESLVIAADEILSEELRRWGTRFSLTGHLQ